MRRPEGSADRPRSLGGKPTAVHDSLLILEEVARCGAGVTAQQISANLRIPKATAYRLLNVLVEEEYLVRLPDLRGFALGVRVRQLAAPGLVHLSRAVREVIDDLRGRSRAGIHLATFGRSGVDAIDIDPDFPLHSHDALFRRSSATAIGRLLDHYRYPETALAGVSSAPEGAGLVRDAAGYVAVQLGELREGYGCLALPLFVDDAALPSAALAFTASVARVQDAVEDLSDLRDRARLLERLL